MNRLEIIVVNKLFNIPRKFLDSGDITLSSIQLNKNDAVVKESVERDKILSEIGVKFSKEYFMKRYNLSEGDFEIC